MPYPGGLLIDPSQGPIVNQINLLADVAITPVNTATDILSLGTLPIGIYYISANIAIKQITNASVTSIRILQGAVVVEEVEVSMAIGDVRVVTIAPFVLQLLAAAIVKVQGFSTVVTGTAVSLVANNGTGSQNFATTFTALRIG